MRRALMATALAAGVLVVWFSQDAFPRGREYHPELGRFMQRDPIGHPDGMSQYEYERSNPVTHRDPSGLRVFFAKSQIAETGGDKTGTITIYNLLRYTADETFEKKWGKDNANAKLKEIAALQAKMIEDYVNKGNYTYNDGKVTWKIVLKVIATTHKAYTLQEHLAAREGLRIVSDEYGQEAAKYLVNMEAGGAYSKVTVLGERREDYNSGNVPDEDPKWHNFTYAALLAHELIGHQLNNDDEVNKGGLRLADQLARRLGHPVESNSIMTYNKEGIAFLNRHFAAGIDDINNITGEWIKSRFRDNTSELNIQDRWFAENSRDTKMAKQALMLVEQIIERAR